MLRSLDIIRCNICTVRDKLKGGLASCRLDQMPGDGRRFHDTLILFAMSEITFNERMSGIHYNVEADGNKLWIYGQCFRSFSKTPTLLETPPNQLPSSTPLTISVSLLCLNRP